jgi:hypothetical protein
MLKLVRLPGQRLRIVALFALLALVFALPIFHQIDNWGIQDWDQHLFYHAVPRQTILEYGQFPLWNPYYCGGTVLLANPQSRFLSPTFVLPLIFGEVRGIKVEIWLHLVIGLLGTYVLARHYGLDRLPAIMAAAIFMLNTMYALNLSVGMTWFMAVAYLPWAFFFYLRAYEDPWQALGCGLALVLMFFGGGVYPLAITLLFLSFYSFVLVAFREQSIARISLILLVILAVTLGLGAIKLFPTIEFMLAHPRRVYDYSGYSLNGLLFALLSRDQTLSAIIRLPAEQTGFWNGVTGGMDENGMYIGAIPLILFFFGIGTHDKRRLFLFLSLIVFLWLSLGNRPRPVELWTLLHLLPVYSSMRIAQRFRIVWMLCLAIFAGFGFQAAHRRLAGLRRGQPAGRMVMPAVLLLVVADLGMVSAPVWKDAFSIPPLETTRTETFHQVWEFPSYNKDGWVEQGWQAGEEPDKWQDTTRIYSSFGSLYPTFLSNIGTINCYESAEVARAATPVDSAAYCGEVYLTGTTGNASILRWTPNRVVVGVDAHGPGYLVWNQNYDPGWRVKGAAGARPVAADGLLAVEVSSETRQVEIRYLPTSFIAGLAVTLVSGVLVLMVLVKRHRVPVAQGSP